MGAPSKNILLWALTVGLGAYYAYLVNAIPNAEHWSSDADLLKLNCSVVAREIDGEINAIARYCNPDPEIRAKMKAYRANPMLPSAEKRSPEAWVQYELARFDSARAQLNHWRAVRERLGCTPKYTDALLPILELIPSQNGHSGLLSVVPYNTYVVYDSVVCTINDNTLKARNGLYKYRFRANRAGKITLQPKVVFKTPLTGAVHSCARSFPLRIRPAL
jgi:hypothetical protein